jgi:lysophospholipase L1-like esterase
MMEKAPRSPQGRRLVGNIAVLLLSSFLLLFFAEIITRLAAPQRPAAGAADQPRGFYAPHPRLGFTMNPSFHGRLKQRDFDTEVRFNSIGLRDREFGPKPAGARRLLLIGDSYTFGWGVEEGERYADRLEERLREIPGARWEVVKAGTNAYSTAHELAWLREYGWSLDPDLVVLQFCMGNDFADNAGADYRVEDGRLVTVPPGPNGSAADERGLKAWARRHSHLYLMLRNLVNQPGVGRADRRRAEFAMFNAQVNRGSGRTREILAEMAAEARTRGVPLVLLVVPMRHQIGEAGVKEKALADYPNTVITETAQALGVPAIDLLTTFRESAGAGSSGLYFRHDAHWTREGHRLAGDSLFDSLRAGGWIPG